MQTTRAACNLHALHNCFTNFRSCVTSAVASSETAAFPIHPFRRNSALCSAYAVCKISRQVLCTLLSRLNSPTFDRVVTIVGYVTTVSATRPFILVGERVPSPSKCKRFVYFASSNRNGTVMRLTTIKCTRAVGSSG